MGEVRWDLTSDWSRMGLFMTRQRPDWSIVKENGYI